MTTNAREEAAARAMAAAFDYPWEPMPEKGREEMRKNARAVLAAADGVAVPAGVKVMTTWRNRNTGSQGLYEAGSMPTVDETHQDYDYSLAFLIPASDAQWAMRHLDSLRDRVGGPALQSLDCVRSWLNAWRATPSPAQPQPAQGTCDCGKKPAAECEKWEPGCDLGQSPEHARVARLPAQGVSDEQLLGAIARGWCSPENSGKTVDPELAQAIAAEVRAAMAAQRREGGSNG